MIRFKINEEKQSAEKVLELFNPETDTDNYVDLDHFADLWLDILSPELDKLKMQKSKEGRYIR